MCKKKQFKYCPSEIDKCMRRFVDFINENTRFKTIASCCGHGKYPMTLVVTLNYVNNGSYFEIFSGIEIPRKKKFYKKDKQGYYYIPETLDAIQEDKE